MRQGTGGSGSIPGGMEPGGLIRRLIDDRERAVTRDEVAEISAYLSRSPFDSSAERRIPPRYRGYSDGQDTLGETAEALTAHRVARVAYDEQWATGTSSEQYVADLHAAGRSVSRKAASPSSTSSRIRSG